MWSLAIYSGIPNELFWESTLDEVAAVLKRRTEAERALTLRAGLIAATIINVNRKKGAPLVQPHDFLPETEEFLTPEEARAFMDRWAEGQGATPPTIVAPTSDEVTKYSGEAS